MTDTDTKNPDAGSDIKRAREILADWCSNHGDKFTMRIPCQDYDDDIVMSRVIDAAEKALAQSQPTEENELREKLDNAYKNIEELSDTLSQLQAKSPEQGQVDNAEYLLRGLCEIREIYCNMENFIPETAPEGYVLQEIRKMYETAVEFIKGYSELARGKGGG